MTATPKHYDVQDKDTAGEARLVYSMDNEAVYGPRAYTLSFRKAIDLGLISDYKIIISVVHAKSAVAEANPLEAMVVAFKKAIAKAPAVSKIISFHRTIKEAENLHRYIETHQNLNDFKPLHVNGFLKSTFRKKTMETFRSHPKALITNARCLTEGIDVPAVDMVAFLNKKRSKIDIIQAIGRSLRKVPGKVYGHVFLPLFVADNKGETLEEAVERADYREIWEVIQALSEQDEALHKRLQKIISVKVVDRIGSSWDAMYSQLFDFQAGYGHCRVLHDISSVLSSWICSQRQAYKQGKLASWKKEKLDDLGFDWDPKLNIWKRYFVKLQDYKKKYGHCEISSNKGRLCSWVGNQRVAYKQSKLESWKVEKLNELGFDWDPFFDKWQKRFQELQDYKKKYGHCVVSKSAYPKLFLWAVRQRKLYREGGLEDIRTALLNGLGFDWDRINNQWQKRFKELQAHKQKNGHCKITNKASSLCMWINNQRMAYKKGRLQDSRVALLNSLGFDWSVRNLLKD